MTQKTNKDVAAFIFNLVVCTIGLGLIIWFAFGLENKHSSANNALGLMLKYNLLVILFLLGVGFLSALPWLKKRKR
jgi:hypothetical protein